jgi:hypothetical protein
MSTLARHRRASRKRATPLVAALAAVIASISPAPAAISEPFTAAATPHLPEPILWKQNRFLIPYQWSAAADQSTIKSVRLFISKDLGTTWQPISEAQPHLRGFTYHAEQDGEFWFSIRTIDSLGRAWPNEPHHPELRVIVDTTFPVISELGGTLNQDGLLDIHWAANDARLDVDSIRIEVQVDGSGNWQPVTLPAQYASPDGTTQGRTQSQLPPQTSKVVLRAEVYDEAGNRSFRGAEVLMGTSANPGANQYPTMVIRSDELPTAAPHTHTSPESAQAPALPYPAAGVTDPFAQRPLTSNAAPPAGAQGWQAAAAAGAFMGGRATVASGAQPWPADQTAGPTTNVLSGSPANGATPTHQAPPADAFPYGDATSLPNLASSPYESQMTTGQPSAYGPVEPFRSVSHARAATTEAAASSSAGDVSSVLSQASSAWQGTEPATSLAQTGVQLPGGTVPMMVGVRTFDLDYSLEQSGSWGISRVELWGTRDGGRTWRQYAYDDDNRSPIRVTVEGEGIYGFRIVAQSPGGPGPSHPQTGDQPELWVGVDLEAPQAELLAVEQGVGNLSDHLILRWRAADKNLDRRPIALFYSSRAGGPWTAIATGLENAGEYSWRLERHLPSQFHLRLEARDTAGNLTAYQTSQPIVLNRAQPSAHLRGVHPPGSARATETTRQQ